MDRHGSGCKNFRFLENARILSTNRITVSSEIKKLKNWKNSCGNLDNLVYFRENPFQYRQINFRLLAIFFFFSKFTFQNIQSYYYKLYYIRGTRVPKSLKSFSNFFQVFHHTSNFTRQCFIVSQHEEERKK